MSHISLTPAKYAQQISRSTLDAAKERVRALHRDPEADPRDILDAEEDRDYARWEDDNTIPWADSPEDVDAPHESSTRVALDGGHADVDVFTDRIEVTIRLGGRSVLGIALSHMEATNLGRAIASPAGATTGDLFHVADTLGVNAGDIMRLRDRAVNA